MKISCIGADTILFLWQSDKGAAKKEYKMAVKVLVKRIVPINKSRKLIPLFRKIRTLAVNQPGYFSGETLRSLDSPERFLVISTWQSSDDWKKWLASEERKEIQDKIDSLLGGKTEYEIFHYGFTE